MAHASITGLGVALPETRLTNDDLAARVDTSDEWIRERTGIGERRVASPTETTASLATDAGVEALKDASLEPSDIDLLIVATATPEQPIPHTGAFVADGLGITCGSFDLAAGCSGFMYSVIVGDAMLANPGVDRVLVIGAETLTRVIDPMDRSTCILFGDGAGAAVLEPSADSGLLAWDTGTDGTMSGILGIRSGGSRRPATHESLDAGEHFLHMEGQEVFRRAVRAVVSSIATTLDRARVQPSEIAWFVPHQANARIIDAAAQRVGIAPERCVQNLERYGNTSAASIPIALREASDDGRLADGDLVLLAGFGAGLTWGCALMRWGA